MWCVRSSKPCRWAEFLRSLYFQIIFGGTWFLTSTAEVDGTFSATCPESPVAYEAWTERVRDVGWSGQAGTLVGPDDKPVLRNVDLRWRRSSKHLLRSFVLQYAHTQVPSWVQLSWAQGKAVLPVSSLITLILSRKNLANLLRIVNLAFLYIILVFIILLYTPPTSHCNIYLF